MNFLITSDANYKNDFNLNKITCKNFKIFFDNNWFTLRQNSISKGTSNNFCIIEFDDTIEISHNQIRDFPLSFNEHTCSNFIKLDNYVPVDGILKYDNKWHLTYQNNFYEDLNNVISKNEAIDIIKKVLIDNTKTFIENNTLDILVPNNNGLDTLTVRSVLDYLNVNYKLFDIKKLNYKKLQNILEKDYYGFNQIQEFDLPKCLVTGFYGDEYILRNPYYVQNLLKNKDVDLVEVFDSKENCYMKNFFNLVYKEKCKKVSPVNISKLSQMICNDIQVWHINNTMIFTPFKDKRLLQLLNCNNDTIISQATDGKLSKLVIEYFNKDLLNLLNHSKNSSDPSWFWQ